MSSYQRSALGTLEALQDYWKLHLSLGMRFVLIALAVVALATAFRDIADWVLEHRGLAPDRNIVPRRVRIASYANRVFVTGAILCEAPAAFWRLGHRDINSDFAYSLQLASTALFIVYLMTDELVRLLAHGTPVKSAWFRCVPLGIAALLLLFIGVNLDVRH